jgi:probable phosphoglycerate mutase
MTARLYFVRHAAHDFLDTTLCGRMPGVSLNEAGRAQSAILAQALRHVNAVHSSPRDRCLETAEAIAAGAGCSVTVSPALDEIEMGAWTGKAFADLRSDPLWRAWNERRAEASPPGGEPMRAAQRRIVEHASAVAPAAPDRSIALVTHADMIKAAIASFLGLNLDAHTSFTIAPASISMVLLCDWGARVESVSETAQRWRGA